VDEHAVRRAMDAYAAHLFATRPEVEEVIVFGSFENGTYAPGSDIDLFIVLCHADQSPRDRIPAFLPADAFPVPVDGFPFTRAEIAERTPSPLLDAVAQSRWRYERVGIRGGRTPKA
jgi:hypothetical protein